MYWNAKLICGLSESKDLRPLSQGLGVGCIKPSLFWNVVGLFDVCGKVGEIPQSSLTPAVPQGGSAHSSCSVKTELQATHREVTSLCSRYSNCRCWPIGAAPEEFFPESFLLLLPLVAQSNPCHLSFPLGHSQPLRTLVSSQ